MKSFHNFGKRLRLFSSSVQFSKIGDMYSNLLIKYPVRTKAVTSGLISASADIICQKYFSENNKEFDYKRFGKFTFLGFAFIGPVLHYWYGFLEVLPFPSVIASSNVLKTVSRLVLDQCIFTPIFLANIMSSVIAMDQVTNSNPINNNTSLVALIKTKLSNDYLNTLQMNYFLWVPAMFMNFAFIPPMYQTLFSNCVGLVWNTYLSFSSFKQSPNTEVV